VQVLSLTAPEADLSEADKALIARGNREGSSSVSRPMTVRWE
jgi:hypothetical protein